MSLFVQLLLVICCHIVSLPAMLLTFCWYSLFSQCSLNNYSHCTWNKLSQILSVKAFVGVMRQNECYVTGPRGFQRRRTMSHGKTKVAVFYEIAVIWDKNTLPWFAFAFFFLFAIIVTLRLHPPESLQPLHSLLITIKSPGPWLFSLFTALLRVAVDYYFGVRLHFQSTLSPPSPSTHYKPAVLLSFSCNASASVRYNAASREDREPKCFSLCKCCK